MTTPIAATLTVLLVSPALARAQEPVTVPPSPPVMMAPTRQDARNLKQQNVKIDVTITLKHGAKPIVKQLSMVAADGRTALGRAGTEVPVPSTSFMPASPTAQQPIRSFNYRSLGINVDAVPEVLDATRVGVRLKMTFSTVYLPETPDVPQPSFGTGSSEIYLVLESGKPLVVTSAQDDESGRGYSVEVKATLLK